MMTREQVADELEAIRTIYGIAGQYAEQIDSAIAHLRQPEGWKLVPVEPTAAMLDAADLEGLLSPRQSREHWDGMLAAAPIAPTAQPADKCDNCWKCKGDAWIPDQMLLCPTCGNKRCPKASDHTLACTGSNEPGQPGSIYGKPADSAAAPAASALFCDMKTDEDKANFFLSGRAYETGVIAKAIQNDVAMAYQRCANYAKELAAHQPPAPSDVPMPEPTDFYTWLKSQKGHGFTRDDRWYSKDQLRAYGDARAAQAVKASDGAKDAMTYTVNGVLMSPLEYIDYLHNKLAEQAQ